MSLGNRKALHSFEYSGGAVAYPYGIKDIQEYMWLTVWWLELEPDNTFTCVSHYFVFFPVFFSFGSTYVRLLDDIIHLALFTRCLSCRCDIVRCTMWIYRDLFISINKLMQDLRTFVAAPIPCAPILYFPVLVSFLFFSSPLHRIR